MRKIRWGILGCAQIAVNKIIPAIHESDLGEVVAIASRDEAKAKRTADTLGIPKAYNSYEVLLSDSSIDAVYIPLPNHLHMEWTILAAEAKKHILCEKPLALNEREAVEMVQACELNNVKLAEAFMYRHHPRYERIKQIISSGEIGELRGMQGNFTFNTTSSKENIRFKAELGGGSLYDVGCYLIHSARYLLEREPQAVSAYSNFDPDYDNVDMMTSGLLEFPGGIGVTFQCGMWAEFRNTLEIIGSEGRIEIPFAFLTGPDRTPNFSVSVKGDRREELVEEVNVYRLQVDQFARSIIQDQPFPFSTMDSINNMRVLEASLKSAKEKIRVVINETI